MFSSDFIGLLREYNIEHNWMVHDGSVVFVSTCHSYVFAMEVSSNCTSSHGMMLNPLPTLRNT